MHASHYVATALLPSLTSPHRSTPTEANISSDAPLERAPLKTAVTGTGCTTSRVALTEHFGDFENFNNLGFSIQGALAYLGWSFLLSEHYVTLVHADYVNYDNLFAYGHWGFEIPAWNLELSAHVTDELVKHCVDFNGRAASFSFLA